MTDIEKAKLKKLVTTLKSFSTKNLNEYMKYEGQDAIPWGEKDTIGVDLNWVSVHAFRVGSFWAHQAYEDAFLKIEKLIKELDGGASQQEQAQK